MRTGFRSDLARHLAGAMKEEREARGTQAEVADALGVHRVTVAKWESGALAMPRMAQLALLALPKKRKRAKRPNAKLTDRIRVSRAHDTKETYDKRETTRNLRTRMDAGLVRRRWV